jgi:type IV secretory pathway TraG/TraD family ATPase VirD4/ribosomal protein L7/L12
MSHFHEQPEDSSAKHWDRIYFRSPEEIATPGTRNIPDGPYGTARLARRRELLELVAAAENNPEDYVRLFEARAVAHDPQVSAVKLDGLVVPLGKDSPNLLVVGRSGAGKTQKVIFPAACHAISEGWSMVYINIKGKAQTHLLRKMAKAYKREREITLVAPQKADRTVAWTAIEGCEDISRAGEVAAVLVGNAAASSRFGEGAWAYNQAEEWLQHAIAAVCTDYPLEQRTLWEVRKIILSGEYGSFAAEHTDFPVLSKFARYVDSANKNADTITATLSEATSFIDEIAPFLSKPELNLEKFIADGGLLIVEIDEYAVKKLRPVIALFLSRLLAMIQRKACDSATGQLPNKLVVLIDELGASGPIYGLDTSLHTCRERRYSFIAGVQSVSQLPAIYGADADVVISGFQSQIVLSGGLDMGSAEYFSRCSGVTTIAVPSMIEEPDRQSNNVMMASGWTLGLRALLLPGDIHSAKHHAILGAPATVFLGDGRTPPFQAYLTSAHEVGQISLMLDEVREQKRDPDRRRRKLVVDGLNGESVETKVQGLTQTRGWSTARILRKIEAVKQEMGWGSADPAMMDWWLKVEEMNKECPKVILGYLEEVQNRKGTLGELFEICRDAKANSMRAAFLYMDFLRENAPGVAGGEPTQKEAVLLEPKSVTKGFAVWLLSVGDQKLQVLKIVRAARGLSLLDSKRLVESAPVVLGCTQTRAQAAEIARRLREAGAEARLETEGT